MAPGDSILQSIFASQISHVLVGASVGWNNNDTPHVITWPVVVAVAVVGNFIRHAYSVVSHESLVYAKPDL